VPQSYGKAREWYEKAAAGGNVTAMRYTGDFYEAGHGVGRDYSKALEWYEKAADAGDATAMRFLGDFYEAGHGVTQDYSKAREWYDKASAAGDEQASTKALAEMRWAQERDVIGQAGKSGHRAEALRLEEDLAKEIEADEVNADGKAGARTADELNSLSWEALFARDFSRALAASERARALDPDKLVFEGNHAHALMFLGRAEEARTIYLSHKDEPLPELDDKSWGQAVVDDFAEFRKAGLDNPLMKKIEAAWAQKKR
jgi:tetratricopeptide (TPR) repeat protein